MVHWPKENGKAKEGLFRWNLLATQLCPQQSGVKIAFCKNQLHSGKTNNCNSTDLLNLTLYQIGQMLLISDLRVFNTNMSDLKKLICATFRRDLVRFFDTLPALAAIAAVVPTLLQPALLFNDFSAHKLFSLAKKWNLGVP